MAVPIADGKIVALSWHPKPHFFLCVKKVRLHRGRREDRVVYHHPPTYGRRKEYNFYKMAQNRKYARPKDPRRRYPKLRDDLRRRVMATQDICAICGREVDKSLPAGTPLSPEIDEIVPVSRGGSPYDIDNLQLVHRICNERKGNRMAGDERLAINPIPNSRNW